MFTIAHALHAVTDKVQARLEINRVEVKAKYVCEQYFIKNQMGFRRIICWPTLSYS